MATYTGRETLYEYILEESIPDGDHVLVLEANGANVSINIEMVNFYTDIIYTGSDLLGNNTEDSRMLVLKYHGNLTINSGALFRPRVRKRGMLVWVNGELINNGTISMTARGASATGQNVYLYKNEDGTFEYIPATGSSGGVATLESGNQHGIAGANATGRRLAGGGSGGSWGTSSKKPGRGGNATSYSGGAGGGGVYGNNSPGSVATDGSDTGGAGGIGGSNYPNSIGGGGAGNPPGNDSHNGSNRGVVSAQSGTGGLLIVFASVYTNRGTVESRGSGTNAYPISGVDRFGGGGGSGGGSINIFYTSISDSGTYNVSGGVFTQHSGITYHGNGGSGGQGTVTLTEMESLFNVDVKISSTTPWFSDQFINISLSVAHENNAKSSYSILINDIEIMTYGVFNTPTNLTIPIDTSNFELGNNKLDIWLIDEDGLRALLSYNIKKEDEDTFTFIRTFDVKENFVVSDNIKVIKGEGIALNEAGTESLNISFPTGYKSKIESVTVDCIADSVSPLKKVRFLIMKDSLYYAYSNGWSVVTKDIENGMTKAQIEAITKTQWKELEPSWFLHALALVIIVQSDETGVGLVRGVTVNFIEPITILCDTITLNTPAYGFKNVLIDGEYQLKIETGLAFDDAEVDYDFYTAPNKVRLRPLDIGNVIGGRYTNVFAFEVISGYDDTDFNVVLFAQKSGVDAEEKDSYGLLYDSIREVTRTRVEFSLVPPPEFDPVYPLTFQLDRMSSKIVYVRIKPTLTITGDDTFQIRLLGRVV